MSPGSKLRKLRVARNLSLRQVVGESKKIARERKNARYLLSLTSLSSLERDEVVPGIYRVHSLALIYDKSVSKLLSFFGI